MTILEHSSPRATTRRPRRGLRLAGAAVLALALVPAGAALAQAAPRPAGAPGSQPVVQQLPSGDSLRLSAALSRLGRDPRDVQALIDAGNAALAMGDADAAVGFFRRAEQVSPRDARVKAGLAGAMVHKGDPFAAIPLFDEAERAGAPPSEIAADRGLAYDLVGDNDTAQRLYKLALARAPDAELTMRLALSQAIAGDKRASDATLLPLLRDQDKAAWRTRAFALAILGQADEAVRISRTVLPEPLAAAIAPYLSYMPTLTPAQQAAAANLGAFPRASEIGRDDPRVALYAPAGGPRARVAAADAGLVPRGEPLGSGTRSRSRKDDKPSRTSRRDKDRLAESGRGDSAASRVAPPDPRPERQASGTTAELPARMASAAPRSPAPALPPIVRPPVPARSEASEMATAAAAEITPVRPVAAMAATAAPARPVVAAASPPPPVPAAAAPAAAPRAPAAGAASGASFDLSRMPQSMSQPVVAPPVDTRPEIQAITTGSTVARPAVVAAAPAPAPALAPVPRASAAAPVAVAAGAPPPVAPSRTVSLADAFSDLGKPVAASAPASGAVDISRIKPAKPAPDPAKVKAEAEKAKAEKAKAEKAKPSHPSRIWVQIGVGRDRKALALDWRKYLRQAPDVFKGRKAHVSDMGSTNRMLIGPFESAKAANAFLGELRRADFGGSYIWTSPAGQVVDPL